MDGLLLFKQHESATFQHEWALEENITTTFFKCSRWLVEETMDLVNCPYHYFCETTYHGNYPPIVGLIVLVFMAASFLSTVAFTVIILTSRSNGCVQLRQQMVRRYLLPSGPISLPLILLVLAKGQRINAVLPMGDMGPLLIQLVHVSAIGFEISADRTLRYALFETSTASGILHASVYLDSVILPYYTGLDALLTSAFSGECPSCVCRTSALVVGGSIVSYRGWALTTVSVVCTLFSRIAVGVFGGERLSILMKFALEGSAWILIASDSVYLMLISPVGGFLARAAHGTLCVLIFLLVLRKMIHGLFPCLAAVLKKMNKKNDLSHNNV